MKKNFKLLSFVMVVFTTLTSCFDKKDEKVEESITTVDPRVPLYDAVGNQSSKLIGGVNQLIVSGNFVKNLSVDSPLEPLFFESEQDILKAIDYLLSNEAVVVDGAISYKPDSRLCTELLALENPNVCLQVLKDIILIQTVTSSTEGILEIYFSGAKSMVLSYGPSEVSVTISIEEIVKTLTNLKQIQIQNGEEPFLNTLPSTYLGSLKITVSNQSSSSFVNIDITKSIDLYGLDNLGRIYNLQIPAVENIVTATMNLATGLVNLNTNIPNMNALLYTKDELDQDHQVSFYFPGLSGSFALDNSISTLIVEALKLSTSYFFITIDGEQSVYITLNEINARLESLNDGLFNLTTLQDFTGQLLIAENPLLTEQGGIYVDLSENSQLSYSETFDQWKVVHGSFMYLGSLDFLSNIYAYESTCLEGDQNTSILITATCKF